MLEVVTLGETMVLFVPSTPGPLRYAHTYTRYLGGAESNMAVGLARLGHRVGWVSRLGDDEFGRYILHVLQGEGVDVSRVIMDGEKPTGVFFKERLGMGRVNVYYYRRYSAATNLSPADLDVAYMAGARFLHLTGITPALGPGPYAAAKAALELARKNGVAVVFDPNLREKLWPAAQARPVMEEFIRQADIVLPGFEEGRALFGVETPEELASRLLAEGPGMVVVKLGPEGALLATREGMERVAGFPVDRVEDPVGAGDGFAAGLLAGMLRGMRPVEATRLGNAVGAFATAVAGDFESLPSWEEVNSFLQGRTGVRR